MTFASFFFPDPLGWGRRLVVQVALSSWLHQCFAIARQYLAALGTRQALLATMTQTSPPSPIGESVCGSRWRCRNARGVALSIGSRYAAHTRMASNTSRAGLAGRPAPGLRMNCFSGGRWRCGISGSTRCQNSSVTTNDCTCFLLKASLRHRVQCGSDRQCILLLRPHEVSSFSTLLLKRR